MKTHCKKVIITGANRGLGLGFVDYYLKNNFEVVATCRQTEAAVALQSLKSKFKTQLTIEELDVSKEEHINRIAQKFKSNDLAFDILINNAGVSIDEPFGKWRSESFAHIFQTNVIGVALFTQAIVPFMNNGGKLINISSGRGSIEANQGATDGLDAYGISKTALNMLSRRLAMKLRAQSIIVVSLNPGWVQTDMGGNAAPTSVHEAVKKMTSTIDHLTMKNSGLFLEFDGSISPF